MNNSVSILVAEDDPNDVFFFKRAVSNTGIQVPVIFLRNGEEVIDYLEGSPPFDNREANPWPALIILDLTMPRVSGFEVLEWMGKHQISNEIPVLAFSGVQNPTEISRAYALGAKFFLIKTADASKWVNVLHRVVEMYGLSKDARAALSTANLEFSVVCPDQPQVSPNQVAQRKYRQ
jgi:CheY-like chemotaxis protein